MLYLDNASTTKVSQTVLEAMKPFLSLEFGNPDSQYYELAENAKKAIDNSRIQVSELLKITKDEVIFNSGATEGNNTVIKGIAKLLKSKGNHIISTTVEHSSVFETLKSLETEGIEVTYLKVNNKCEIDINEFMISIRPTTILVSVMWVNNEVGTVFPIEKIAEICLLKKIFFHTDSTQAIGKIDIDLSLIKGISFLTFSGHKINGPKGIGALIIRKDSLGFTPKLPPLIHGGEQEFGFRAGTSNTPGIVGLGAACNDIKLIEVRNNNLDILEKRILEILFIKYSDFIVINNDFNRVKGILNLRFKSINNQILLKNSIEIFNASTGSACSNSKPSRTLLSMGLSHKEVSESIRISISHNTKIDELEVLKVL